MPKETLWVAMIQISTSSYLTKSENSKHFRNNLFVIISSLNVNLFQWKVQLICFKLSYFENTTIATTTTVRDYLGEPVTER